MPTLRQVRTKIGSTKSIKRITGAMKLISVVKLQRAQEILLPFRAYSDAFSELAKSIATRCDPEEHPLLRIEDSPKNLHIVFMTSDRGLCGSFNSNLIRKTETFLAVDAKGYEKVEFQFLGRRGRDYWRRKGIEPIKSYTGVSERNYREAAGEIAEAIIKGFVKREYDEVILVYNYFRSAISQVITFKKLLPIERLKEKEEETGGGTQGGDYLYEPSRGEVLNVVLPKYVEISVRRAVLESITSEHGARMSAMDNATRNADDVIRRLTLLFNKTRQAAITKELMDIVNGAEAQRRGG